jgi:hypothetical protein
MNLFFRGQVGSKSSEECTQCARKQAANLHAQFCNTSGGPFAGLDYQSRRVRCGNTIVCPQAYDFRVHPRLDLAASGRKF